MLRIAGMKNPLPLPKGVDHLYEDMEGLVTVSYTHLDVYKRQVVQYGGLAGGGSTLRLVKAQRHAVVFRGFHSAGPVSYTHLDVYKRQGRTWGRS